MFTCCRMTPAGSKRLDCNSNGPPYLNILMRHVVLMQEAFYKVIIVKRLAPLLRYSVLKIWSKITGLIE